MQATAQIAYYQTEMLLNEFNEQHLLFQIRKIADGIGVYLSYSKEFPNVIQNLPDCEDYNSILICIDKLIDPLYSPLENSSAKDFLNIMIFIEKTYILNLLGDELKCDSSGNQSNIFKNLKFQNIEFQKKWHDITLKWTQSLEISLFSSKIPNIYIEAWVHQYFYEMAYESYEMLYPSATTTFKQDDIKKIQDLEFAIKNTQYKAIPSINEMAANVGMSPTKFKKVFKEVFGKSTHQYILDIKVEQAKSLLATNMFSISQIAYKVGFNHPSDLTRLIKNKYNVMP